MLTFIIDDENRIIRSVEKAIQGREAFTTKEDLAALAARWPGKRLIDIWNEIPGVKPIQRFTNRKMTLDRIWRAIQLVAAMHATPLDATKILRPKRIRKARRQTRKLPNVRPGSKKAEILQLLQREGGVTLREVMAATGWQAHSVRGFISAGGKRMGLRVASSKRQDGQRVYQIR